MTKLEYLLIDILVTALFKAPILCALILIHKYGNICVFWAVIASLIPPHIKIDSANNKEKVNEGR